MVNCDITEIPTLLGISGVATTTLRLATRRQIPRRTLCRVRRWSNGGDYPFKALLVNSRPKLFILLEYFFGGRRRQRRVIGEGLELVHQAMRLEIEQLEIITDAGMEIIKSFGLAEGSEEADLGERLNELAELFWIAGPARAKLLLHEANVIGILQ